jgi:hypothetical protein
MSRKAGAFVGVLRFCCAASILLSCAALVSCRKPVEDTQGSWPGIYRNSGGPAGTGISELSVDQAGKKEFSFFLRLIQENGFTREISGAAAYKGRTALFSKDGIDLAFALEESNPPAIMIREGATKTLSADGFAPSLRLPRESVRGQGAADTVPGEASVPAGAPAAGSAFKFGYYLPEGVDPKADALPESFVFLFFDKENMNVREISMFEGNLTEGRELGTFTITDDSLQLQSKDPKTGKKKAIEWKRGDAGVLVSDSGQRYFFWKDNLQE